MDEIENFYVNLSFVDIASLVDSPVLEFVDGVSGKDPTALLSNCNCSSDPTLYPTFASINGSSYVSKGLHMESFTAVPTGGTVSRP
jgi:hypothetical protein